MRYMGIDYSLVSPAITILNDDDTWKTYFLTNIKKHDGKFGNITGILHLPYVNNVERYENIALWALKLASKSDTIFIEDYSLGSAGKVFNIAECTGILKYTFYLRGLKITPVPPSTIKKFATGKGNATKEMMYASFIQMGHPDLSSLLGCRDGRSPLSDCVDSYWIAKYAKTFQV